MKDDVPIITVEYEYGLRENANGGGMKILLSSGGYVMLRNLLEINGTRAGKRSTAGATTTSYFLPLTPLSSVAIGSLSKDTGCIVCGNSTKSVCSACHSVSYCSRGEASHTHSYSFPIY